MVWWINRCVPLRLIHCGKTFNCILIMMRVLLQTSRQLAPPTNASVKAASCGEWERPCATFDPLTGQGESTAYPAEPQFMAETNRSNTQNVWNLVTVSVSIPQLYQEATWEMSVSRRTLSVIPFTCIGGVWPLKRLFSQHLLLHYDLVWCSVWDFSQIGQQVWKVRAES